MRRCSPSLGARAGVVRGFRTGEWIVVVQRDKGKEVRHAEAQAGSEQASERRMAARSQRTTAHTGIWITRVRSGVGVVRRVRHASLGA